MSADVTLKIDISTNDTQCVSLQVQDKDIKAKKVYLQLVKTYVRPFFSLSGSMGLCARMSPLVHGGGGPSQISSANLVVSMINKQSPERGLCLRTAHYV